MGDGERLIETLLAAIAARDARIAWQAEHPGADYLAYMPHRQAEERAYRDLIEALELALDDYMSRQIQREVSRD